MESEGVRRYNTFVDYLKAHCTVKVVAGSGSKEGPSYDPRYTFSPQEKPLEQGEASSQPTALLYQVNFHYSEVDRKKIIIDGDVYCGPTDPQNPEAGPYFAFVNADFSDVTFEGGKVEFQVHTRLLCVARRVRKT